MTTSVIEDVSPLLFKSQKEMASLSRKEDEFELPWVGPVQVVVSSSSSTIDEHNSSRENQVQPGAVVHGRGLVATRDIDAGECLFCTEPTVKADVKEVLRVYQSKPQLGLEGIAETILLKKMKRCFKSNKNSERIAAASFLPLTSEHNNNTNENDNDMKKKTTVETTDTENEISLMNILLGCAGEKNVEMLVTNTNNMKKKEEEERFLGIIRHNAFGPDFHNYVSMEETIARTNDADIYCRILGLYPFAAIINHSCSPNAVRVFANEVMVVHSSKPIKKGEEIVWSYIPPAQTYRDRQNQIFGKYGFTCCCERCHQEQLCFDAIHDLESKLSAFETLNRPKLDTNFIPISEWNTHMEVLEEILSTSQSISSGDTSRSLRLGYANLYINYFNAALSNAQKMSKPIASIKREAVLDIAGKLHFAFASFHNASTEHMSILHLCYEIIACLHSDLDDKQKTLGKVRFWTDQLKRVHMIRYGKLGNNVESIREVMKHTRLILRNLNGLEKAQHKFI